MLLKEHIKCVYNLAGISFHSKVICMKNAIMINTSDSRVRLQPEMKKKQARQHLNILDIFTLAGPYDFDLRPLRLS